MQSRPPLHGQGAITNPESRFAEYSRESELAQPEWQRADRQIHTSAEIIRSLITRNQSPDIPFNRSINPYRGCEHGCIYCYARPSHAYLGLSPGLDFERQIFIKQNAPEILQKELRHKRYRPEPIVLGANTDPYQPVEKKTEKSRAILKVLLEHRHPVILITKSRLILRDLDLLNELNRLGLVHVNISITSLDAKLTSKLEPRASTPTNRLHTLQELSRTGLRPGVMLAPVIPGLTDQEMEPILKAAHKSGARQATYILLRLPHEVKQLFVEWLQHHYPEKAERILSLIKQTRQGQMYNAQFHTRMRGTGNYADLLANRFRLSTRKLGYSQKVSELRTDAFTHGACNLEQMHLFS